MPRAAHLGLVEEQKAVHLTFSTTGLKTFINQRTGQLSLLTTRIALE
jgi:hypothetical protein